MAPRDPGSSLLVTALPSSENLIGHGPKQKHEGICEVPCGLVPGRTGHHERSDRESDHIDRRLREAPRSRQTVAPGTDDRGASRRTLYLSSDRARLASSFPAKLAGELSAAVKALRAPSLSPTFRDAIPRWY